MNNAKSSLFQRLKPIIYYFLAALFLLYEMSLQSSPSVMATQLMPNLQLDAGAFGLAMGAYFFSYTLMQIPVGLLFDRYSAKTILVIATMISALGALLFSLGHVSLTLAIARFISGFGSAFAFVGVLVIADQWFEAKHFAFLVGIAQWVAAVGAMTGEMPLAFWVHHYGWRHTALLLFYIGLLLFLLMASILRGKGVVSTVNAIKPMQSLRNILKNKQTFWIALYAFSAWAPITLFAELWGVPYLIARQHTSNMVAAQYSSVIWIGLAIASPLLGWFSDRLQRRRFFMLLCSMLAFFCSIVILYSHYHAATLLVVVLLLMGVGAAGQILCFALVRDHYPKHDLAVAIGIINMAVVIGGALFQPGVGILLKWHAAHFVLHAHSTYRLTDYRFALGLLPCINLIGMLTSFFLIRDVKDSA